jgi:glutathione S-transferase
MTAAPPILTGYRHSVYTRAVRIALAEKRVAHRHVEHDPFADGAAGPHPFGRVPHLGHGKFEIFETAAILTYVDAAFEGPSLRPAGARAQARAIQVAGIVDAYAYWPLVRQVYSHAVFRPAVGEPFSDAEIAAGMQAAPVILAALDAIAREGLVLGDGFTTADCHLAPMIAAFTAHPPAAALLATHPSLSAWWDRTARRASVRDTAISLGEGDQPATRVQEPLP